MWVDKITKINLIRSHPKNKNHYLSEGIEEGGKRKGERCCEESVGN